MKGGNIKNNVGKIRDVSQNILCAVIITGIFPEYSAGYVLRHMFVWGPIAP
jgi:hypothetical protein